MTNEILDLRGKQCPEVILMLRKKMAKMCAGDIVKVISGDAGSIEEMECYVKYGGAKLINKSINKEKDEYIYMIQK